MNRKQLEKEIITLAMSLVQSNIEDELMYINSLDVGSKDHARVLKYYNNKHIKAHDCIKHLGFEFIREGQFNSEENARKFYDLVNNIKSNDSNTTT